MNLDASFATFLAAFLETFADRVADRVLARLAPAPAVRVLLDNEEAVSAAGAPSVRWVRDRARRGAITIRGPRGAQYVDAVELAQLVASTRARKPAEVMESDLGRDVVLLAERRRAAGGSR